MKRSDTFLVGYFLGCVLTMALYFVLTVLTSCGRAGDSDERTGPSCIVAATDNGSRITCPNGSTTEVLNGTTGNAGADGSDGADGVDGQDGVDGAQGSVGPVGPQGDRGEPGEPAVLPAGATLEVIDPCGKQSSHDEILFRLSDRRILAYFESGSNRYLAELVNGSYVTTDGTGCRFTILNGEVQ